MRCLVTACRVIARCSHSSPSVWPFLANSRSSNWRRLGSASALNTLSMATICNQLVACQAAILPALRNKGRLPCGALIVPLAPPLLLSRLDTIRAAIDRTHSPAAAERDVGIAADTGWYAVARGWQRGHHGRHRRR